MGKNMIWTPREQRPVFCKQYLLQRESGGMYVDQLGFGELEDDPEHIAWMELPEKYNPDMPEKETITITKKAYDGLVEDQNWLECLEAAGVDNWEGWDYAVDIRDGKEA